MIEAGIPSIGLERRSQPKCFWIFVAVSGLPIVVWSNSQEDLKSPGLDGHSKQSLNTRTTGYPKNGGRMETHIAQGFLRHLLNEDEAKSLIRCARKVGRYLIPLEVSKILNKEIKKTVDPLEERRMGECWLDFCKKYDVDQRSSMTNLPVLKTWWGYVMKNYHEPLPESSPWDR